jgi:CTP:molybdopterin cytidylyltransferase MocA
MAHWPWYTDPVVMAEIQALNAKLDAILAMLKTSAKREVKMAGELDQLEEVVTLQTTVIGSAVSLLEGLKALLDAAIASGDMSRVVAVNAQIEAQTQALAAAVFANTPA